MHITIREAEPRDAAAAIAFVHRLAEEPGTGILLGPGEFRFTVEEEAKLFADYAAADNALFLLAEADGQIVGSLNIRGGSRRATRHAAGLGISVDRDWRSQGIGNRLMARALEWARGTGVLTRVELQVLAGNAAARRLYEKHGFEVEGRLRRAAYRDGAYHDTLVMGLLLEEPRRLPGLPAPLAALAGEWAGTQRLWLAPGEPVRESATSAAVHLPPESPYLSLHYEWAADGQPQEGHLVLRAGEAALATWTDTWHTAGGIMELRGTTGLDGTASVLGSYPAPDGPDWGWRIVVEPLGEDAFRLDMFNRPPGSPELLAVWAAYTRQAPREEP